MKIEIKAENNCFVVSDEFNLISEEFKTYQEAIDFLTKKFADSKIFRSIFYVKKEFNE